MNVVLNERSSPTLNLVSDCRLVRLLVNFVLKDGKKTLAIRLVNSSICNVLEILNVSMEEFISVVEDRMIIWVGFFKRRMGSRNYRVPYMLDSDRAYRLSLKLLYRIAKRNQKRDFVTSLATELTALYRGENSLFLQEKLRINREAKANRVFGYMIGKFKVKDPECLKLDMTKIE